MPKEHRSVILALYSAILGGYVFAFEYSTGYNGTRINEIKIWILQAIQGLQYAPPRHIVYLVLSILAVTFVQIQAVKIVGDIFHKVSYFILSYQFSILVLAPLGFLICEQYIAAVYYGCEDHENVANVGYLRALQEHFCLDFTIADDTSTYFSCRPKTRYLAILRGDSRYLRRL